MTYWHNAAMVVWAAVSVLLWKIGYEEEDSIIVAVLFFIAAALSTAGVITVWTS